MLVEVICCFNFNYPYIFISWLWRRGIARLSSATQHAMPPENRVRNSLILFIFTLSRLGNEILFTNYIAIFETLRLEWRNSTPHFIILPKPENVNNLHIFILSPFNIFQISKLDACVPLIQLTYCFHASDSE